MNFTFFKVFVLPFFTDTLLRELEEAAAEISTGNMTTSVAVVEE